MTEVAMTILANDDEDEELRSTTTGSVSEMTHTQQKVRRLSQYGLSAIHLSTC